MLIYNQFKMKKRYKIAITLLIVVCVTAFFLTNNVLPYAIIQPPRIEATNALQVNNIPFEDVEVISFDTLKLKGYHVKSALDITYASMILVHGIGGCKEHFSELAIDLSNEGYDVWFFDNRAHGISEGQYSTYGFYEKKDITKIVDEVKQRSDSKIGIWGNSLGGAIAIQALEIDDRIDFGIIESTFTDLNQIVYDYQKRIAKGIGLRFICNHALKKAGEIANFNPNEVSPIKSVLNINQPVFFAHGDNDKNIKVEYGKQLFENLASTQKELVIVEGGGHFGLGQTGGEEYKNKIHNFLKKQ